MKTSARIIARLFLALLLCGLPRFTAAAIQDPFGNDDPGAVGMENAENARADNNEKGKQAPGDRFDINERSAVVLSLRANPPRTAAEFARAIQLTIRIKRWDEAGHWLDEAIKLGINEINAAEMVQTAGSQTFLSLVSLDSPLSPARKLNAKKVLDLSSAFANDPRRLRASVSALRSQNKSERIQARRLLESSGTRGVATLINHLMSDGSAAPNPTMCEAFSLMGKPAFAAWQAAMSSPHPDARGRLALLAARSGQPSLSTELCVAALDQRIDASVREELDKVATSRGKSLPNNDIIFRHVVEQMHKSLDSFQVSRWMDEPDAFAKWQLATDGRSVVEQPARVADLDWCRAVQLAQLALHFGEYADVSSGIAVAVIAEEALRSAPNEAIVDFTMAKIAPSIPVKLQDSYEFACLIWDGALQCKLGSAQLFAIQNLSRWTGNKTIPSPVRDRIVSACGSGFSAVRYAASHAMLGSLYTRTEDGSSALVDMNFDGRNRLEKVLAEMRLLEGNPLALVIGGASDLRTHTRTLLESFGFRVLEAASATQTMAFLREGQPAEAVFIVSRVLEMNLGELAQRIRAYPTMGTCPIAILAESLSRGEHSIASEDVRIVMGSVPPELSGLTDILRRMRIVSQAPNVDAASRNAWQELSAAYWSDRQRFFVSAQPKKLETAAQDTPLGQQKLIQIAIDPSIALPKREQASQNFVQSVKQFGVMLSSETVKAQYDEYNKRGSDELELRRILGRILDSIEAAKGDRAWTEVAP